MRSPERLLNMITYAEDNAKTIDFLLHNDALPGDFKAEVLQRELKELCSQLKFMREFLDAT